MTIRAGSWCDCDRDLTAWVDGRRVRTSTGLDLAAPPNPVGLRCARSGAHIGLVLVDGARDVAVLSLNGGPWQDLVHAFGQRAVEIRGVPGGFQMWVVTSPATYETWAAQPGLAPSRTGTGTMPATSQGILDSPGGQILWTDAHEWTDGLRYATRAGEVCVGQKAQTSESPGDALLAAWGPQGPRRFALQRELARDPRVAVDGDGRYRIVAMLEGGRVFELVAAPPFSEAAAPAPPAGLPPPAPVPAPAPPVAAGPSASSSTTSAPRPPAMPAAPLSIDLPDVDWLHADVSNWRVTSRVTAIRFEPRKPGAEKGRLAIEHTMAGKWPTLTDDGGLTGEGNPWVLGFVGGRWRAATYEWLRPGQTWKGIDADNIGPHTKKAPLETWVPQPGEPVGFFVSTYARDNKRTSNERSDIVLVRWGDEEIVWREGAQLGIVTGPQPTATPIPAAGPGVAGAPVPVAPTPPPIPHHSDETLGAFVAWLDEKYRSDLGRGPRNVHVDPVGLGKWVCELVRLLDEGRTPREATLEVNRRINALVGLAPAQGPAVPFGSLNPAPAGSPPADPPSTAAASG
jgi:hypothetical protein